MIHPIKNVLWATDFSAESKEALAYASFFAKTFKAKLIALHVVPDFAPALYEAWPRSAGGAGRQDRGQQDLAPRSSSSTCARPRASAPTRSSSPRARRPRSSSRTAKKEGADLIVVGRKGHLGPRTEPHRQRHPPDPAGLPRPGPGDQGHRRQGPADPGKILVPTDFSASEDIERDHAWELAKALGSSLTFLYVLELFGHDFRLTDEMFASVLKKLQARQKREHKAVEIARGRDQGRPRLRGHHRLRRDQGLRPHRHVDDRAQAGRGSSSAARPRRSSPTAACPSSPSPGRNSGL
ncbi:MAG: universal stress protein [Comamonadaceae bacterium]|nr:universal stress protein [Comamonadaceae bacterium]